jgi:hypothetical protein
VRRSHTHACAVVSCDTFPSPAPGFLGGPLLCHHYCPAVYKRTSSGPCFVCTSAQVPLNPNLEGPAQRPPPGKRWPPPRRRSPSHTPFPLPTRFKRASLRRRAAHAQKDVWVSEFGTGKGAEPLARHVMVRLLVRARAHARACVCVWGDEAEG